MRLRRTIGLKKDEFTLDRKHITCAHRPQLSLLTVSEHMEKTLTGHDVMDAGRRRS